MPDNHSTAIRKRSVSIAGHRTSVSLEQAFWQALKEIAVAEGRSVAAIIAGIDAGSTQADSGRDGKKVNLSSALRVYVLEKIRERGSDR